ncbi:MAG: tripartite tricarboxylate transporter TctB family protein [Nitrospinota bacterium]
MATDGDDIKPMSPIMLRLEVGLAALLTCIAGSLSIFMPKLIATGGIPAAKDVTTLSPIFFPRVAFGLLSLLCLSYLGKSIQRLKDPSGESADGDVDRFSRAAQMMAIAAGYAYFVTVLGFGLATLIMTAIVAVFLGLRQWWAVLSVSVLAPIVIRFIFERLLLISLPRSEFEFIAAIEDGIMKFLTSIFFGW